MIFLNKILNWPPRHAILSKRYSRKPCRLSAGAILPTNEGVLGEIALSSLRVLSRFLSTLRQAGVRVIYGRRRLSPADALKTPAGRQDFYVCNLSNFGQHLQKVCMPADLPSGFYGSCGSASGIGHLPVPQRFSTNTVPRCTGAAPFRYWRITARLTLSPATASGRAPVPYKFQTPMIPDLQSAAPFVNETVRIPARWTACWNCCWAGWTSSAPCACWCRRWQNNPDMDGICAPSLTLTPYMEPWDGPAGIVMSDGRFAACNLDRNGLRPARYHYQR